MNLTTILPRGIAHDDRRGAPSGLRGAPVRLRGAPVRLRSIDAADVDGLRAFYDALSPDGRASRFLGAGAPPDEAACAYFCAADGLTRAGWVAVTRRRGAGDGRIVGHLCLEPTGVDGELEVGVAVADELQGGGIGSALFRNAARWARARGIRRIVGSVFLRNTRIFRLLASAGYQISVRPGDAGVVTCIVELPLVEPAPRAVLAPVTAA